jgi:hypothetical protein
VEVPGDLGEGPAGVVHAAVGAQLGVLGEVQVNVHRGFSFDD